MKLSIKLDKYLYKPFPGFPAGKGPKTCKDSQIKVTLKNPLHCKILT